MTDRPGFCYLARVERDLTGGVTLHVVRGDETVELHEGDEFLTITTVFDLYAEEGT